MQRLADWILAMLFIAVVPGSLLAILVGVFLLTLLGTR